MTETEMPEWLRKGKKDLGCDAEEHEDDFSCQECDFNRGLVRAWELTQERIKEIIASIPLNMDTRREITIQAFKALSEGSVRVFK